MKAKTMITLTMEPMENGNRMDARTMLLTAAADDHKTLDVTFHEMDAYATAELTGGAHDQGYTLTKLLNQAILAVMHGHSGPVQLLLTIDTEEDKT